RSTGLISFRMMRQSGGMRFAYSPNPVSIQAGILWPTAAIMSCMIRWTYAASLGLAGARLAVVGAFLAGAFLGAVAALWAAFLAVTLFEAATLMVLPTAFLAPSVVAGFLRAGAFFGVS